jgi:hypothetical protein
MRTLIVRVSASIDPKDIGRDMSKTPDFASLLYRVGHLKTSIEMLWYDEG